MTTVDVAIIEIAGRGDALAQELAGFPGQVRVLRRSAGPVPRRRADALRESTAEAVLLVEDTVRPGADWAQGAQSCLADGSLGAASGTLRLSPSLSARETAWALSEYGAVLTQRPGIKEALPGVMLLVRREPALHALQGPALREGPFVAALRRAGWCARLDAGLEASLVCAPDDAGPGARFRAGRGWAAQQRQAQGWSPAGRAARLVGWPALAAARCQAALGAERRPAVVARVAALSCGWALGEGVGAVLGGPTDDGHWR